MHISKGKIALFAAAALFIGACIILKTMPDTLIGAAFCHQIPSRSPGFHFPFCYRCCGLFSGIFFGLFSFYIIARPKSSTPAGLFAAAVLAFVLFLTDALNSASFIPFDLYKESEAGRFLTAFPFGFFLAKTILFLFSQFISIAGKNIPDSFLNRSCIFILSAGLSFILLFSNNPLLTAFFRVIVCAGSCMILCVLYAILVYCIALLRGGTHSVRQIFVYAMVLCLLQITAFGSIHLFLIHSGVLMIGI